MVDSDDNPDTNTKFFTFFVDGSQKGDDKRNRLGYGTPRWDNGSLRDTREPATTIASSYRVAWIVMGHVQLKQK